MGQLLLVSLVDLELLEYLEDLAVHLRQLHRSDLLLRLNQYLLEGLVGQLLLVSLASLELLWLLVILVGLVDHQLQ